MAKLICVPDGFELSEGYTVADPKDVEVCLLRFVEDQIGCLPAIVVRHGSEYIEYRLKVEAHGLFTQAEHDEWSQFEKDNDELEAQQEGVVRG